MFRVPEKHRLTTGPMQSHASDGNNGLFIFLSPLDPANNTKFVCIASDCLGWEHISVQVTEHGNMEGRCPTWYEMCIVKDTFWEEEATVVQYHPAHSEYVNCHPHVLHLWRPTAEHLPRPPSFMVGPKESEAENVDEFLADIAQKLASELGARTGLKVEIRNGNVPQEDDESEPFDFKTINSHWTEFAHAAIPTGASEHQIRDMRSSFYAGCVALMSAFHAVGSDDISEDDATAYMERLSFELKEFTKQVRLRAEQYDEPESK